MKIALLSCSKNKQDSTCTAREMYSKSALFRKSASYAESRYEKWLILSAKYGLLDPNTLIRPYNVTLNDMGIQERKDWSQRVYAQLSALGFDAVDFYAGKHYRQFLIPMLEADSVVCDVPLKGMGIGQQLKFYTDALMS